MVFFFKEIFKYCNSIYVLLSPCRLENKELPYNAFAHRENRSDGSESSTSDLCTLYRARAERMSLDQLSQDTESSTAVEESDNSEKKWVIFIELIGSRFLRRMVRILVVSNH